MFKRIKDFFKCLIYRHIDIDKYEEKFLRQITKDFHKDFIKFVEKIDHVVVNPKSFQKIIEFPDSFVVKNFGVCRDNVLYVENQNVEEDIAILIGHKNQRIGIVNFECLVRYLDRHSKYKK